jgi:hypothetical protein
MAMYKNGTNRNKKESFSTPSFSDYYRSGLRVGEYRVFSHTHSRDEGGSYCHVSDSLMRTPETSKSFASF